MLKVEETTKRKKGVDAYLKSSDNEVSDTEFSKGGDKTKKDNPFMKKKKNDIKCFYYNGPHMMHTCPKRKALSTIKKISSKKESEMGSSSDSKGER